MAGNIPTPRSYQTIVGDMINTFLTNHGLKGIKIGNPVLTIIEAVGQSIFRNSQDLFNLLDAVSIDRATGTVLDRHAENEDTRRTPATFATGSVNVTDSRVTRIFTTIYSGAAAPTVGGSFIVVADDSVFPNTTGNIYIGRGTQNEEGPIGFTKAGSNVLTLGTPLTKFHNVNDDVVLAQYGTRTIPSGTIIKTKEDSTTTYSTTAAAIIMDGEATVTGIPIECGVSGTDGNTGKNTVEVFATVPFTGATVTNPNPLTNGYAIENDESLRERIKNLRKSRSKGTALALATAARGVTAPDEHKTVIGATVISTPGEPAVLYIDDGTGYEELDYGVSFESIIASALGGEQYAQLTTGIPVAKAFLVSALSAPFNLIDGGRLSVRVGGVLSSVAFSSSQFVDINNASAYEIVSAINGAPGLLFSARTASNGTKVVIFAKSFVNEDIEVVQPTSGDDANLSLGFPSGIHYSLWLYKNGELLYKDGKEAIVSARPNTEWSLFPAQVSVTIEVDGTGPIKYVITGADFVEAGTGYNTVSQNNSLASWAQVFNYKIPGITASVVGNSLFLTSNLGRSSRAQVAVSIGGTEVTGESLVNLRMFELSDETGRTGDYTLDRNTGQIKLAQPLVVGDSLTAGSTFTQGFIRSDYIAGTIDPNSEALFVVIDGSPTIIPHAISPATSLDFVTGATETTLTLTGSTFPTDLRQGDWMVTSDASLNSANKRAARINAIIDPTTITLASPSYFNETKLLTNNGLHFVRTESLVQKIQFGVGAVAPSALATTITSQLLGGVGRVYDTNYVDIVTNTYGAGDITVISSTNGVLGYPTLDTQISNVSHLASIESGNPQSGTPNYHADYIKVLAQVNGTKFTATDTAGNLGLDGGEVLEFHRRLASDEYGNNLNRTYPVQIANPSSADLTVTDTRSDEEWVADDVAVSTHPFAIVPEDTLRATIDKDSISKNVSVPMSRLLKGAPAGVYADTLNVVDGTTLGQLQTIYGSSFNLTNYAVFMNARTASHFAIGADKQILWRYARRGAEGEKCAVRYTNPTTHNSSISVSVSPFSPFDNSLNDIKIQLPSADPIDIPGLTNTTAFYVYTTGAVLLGGRAWVYQYAKYKLPIGNVSRTSNVVTVTPTLFTNQTDIGVSVGQHIYITGVDAAFPSGMKVITNVTPTTFDYNEAGADGVSTAVLWASTAGLSDPDFSNLVAGDIITFSGTNLPAANEGTYQIHDITPTPDGVFAFRVIRQAFVFDTGVAMAGQATIKNPNNVIAFQITATKAADIVTAVNTSYSNILTGTVIPGEGAGTGQGLVGEATLNEFNKGTTNYTGASLAASVAYWPMFDGLKYIETCNLGTNTITLKGSITADVPSYGDWANEQMSLVPVTAQNISDWLNSYVNSTLPGLTSVARANNNQYIQITTNTIGNEGGVQVIGGTANSAAATVVGAAEVLGSYAKISVPTSQIAGFSAHNWVKLQANYRTFKIVDFVGSDVEVSFDGVKGLWKVEASNTIINETSFAAIATDYTILKHYPAALFTSAAPAITATGGDWLKAEFSGSYSIGNTGYHRVIKSIMTDQLWIDNLNASEEFVTISDAYLYTYDSVVPGDTFVVLSDVLGVGNVGRWTIAEIQAPGTFWVYGTMTTQPVTTITAVTANGLRIEEAEPLCLYKRIASITPTSTAEITNVLFDDSSLMSKVSASAGYSMIALDKLQFPTGLTEGVNCYDYSGGLLGEVNRVIYGDATSPAVYPGVVAAGANVTLSGSLIKRIQVTLNIRVYNNESASDNVKNAVASVINNSPIGQSIAISDIVAAANSINGVAAVSVSSPLYNGTVDLIAVQANEKPRVIDIDTDITVNILG